MHTLALIPVAKSADLTQLCVASLRRFAPTVRRILLVTQADRALQRWLDQDPEEAIQITGYSRDARDHALALEEARRRHLHDSYDVVVCLDNDVVITSDRWLGWLEACFLDPRVGAAGAWHGDLAAKGLLHASMLAMRGEWFSTVRTFHSQIHLWEPGRKWLDTLGVACVEIASHARLEGVEPTYAPAWTDYAGLWRHLGGGTHAAHPLSLRHGAHWVAAALGSREAAHKVKQTWRRQVFLASGWGVVNGR
jgi:hypothetical protein